MKCAPANLPTDKSLVKYAPANLPTGKSLVIIAPANLPIGKSLFFILKKIWLFYHTIGVDTGLICWCSFGSLKHKLSTGNHHPQMCFQKQDCCFYNYLFLLWKRYIRTSSRKAYRYFMTSCLFPSLNPCHSRICCYFLCKNMTTTSAFIKIFSLHIFFVQFLFNGCLSQSYQNLEHRKIFIIAKKVSTVWAPVNINLTYWDSIHKISLYQFHIYH